MTRALTLWPEWAMACRFLFKLHDGVENRPRPFPASLAGRRIAIHAGRFVGGRAAGYDEGIAAVLAATAASGWRMFRPNENTFVFRRGVSPGLVGGKLVYEAEQEGDVKIRLPHDIVTSAIVCTAVLDRVIEPTPNPPLPWMVPTGPDGLHIGEPSYGWRFRDVEILDKPIAVAGAQGIWTL